MRTVLDLGPLVAPRDHPRRTACDERLLAAGQVKQVALTAWRHTLLTSLNAMLTPRTPWQPQEVQSDKNPHGTLDNQDSCSARASLRLSGAPET